MFNIRHQNHTSVLLLYNTIRVSEKVYNSPVTNKSYKCSFYKLTRITSTQVKTLYCVPPRKPFAQSKGCEGWPLPVSAFSARLPWLLWPSKATKAADFQTPAIHLEPFQLWTDTVGVEKGPPAFDYSELLKKPWPQSFFSRFFGPFGGPKIQKTSILPRIPKWVRY